VEEVKGNGRGYKGIDDDCDCGLNGNLGGCRVERQFELDALSS
jgi:hypothetical protein